MKQFFLFLAPRFPWIWRFVTSVPLLRRWANRYSINLAGNCTPPRPHPFSLWGKSEALGSPGTYVADFTADDYTTWTGLVDRTNTGRHLPPAPLSYTNPLPNPDEFVTLFRRGPTMVQCPKSTALFGFFAQWFTAGFLRTDSIDTRKNTSNHEM